MFDWKLIKDGTNFSLFVTQGIVLGVDKGRLPACIRLPSLPSARIRNTA
jgi:hypothetical protein